ncbi:MAG: glutamate--tRNA ligase, partial [Candidatus Atribacteria bacterium]|nr:glutamate--tRNA ligase [Candidatus Atribacteria bacterium]
RGDDHISNTPRQVLLYRAFGFPVPEFAHIPMILGKDRTRLSKRHGSPSVTYYRDKGYLPEAMLNYLARLSWATGEEEKEIFTREEIIERFSLAQVTKHAAVFDLDKLNWMNGVYIRESENRYLVSILKDILLREGRFREEDFTPPFLSYLEGVISIMKDRLKYLGQLLEEADYFFREDFAFHPEAFEKILLAEGADRILWECLGVLKTLSPFTVETLENAIRQKAEALGVKAASLIHPLRIAVSGQKVGPGLFELLAVLGKDRVISRIERALRVIEERKQSL